MAGSLMYLIDTNIFLEYILRRAGSDLRNLGIINDIFEKYP
jgi:predicted nucleic acid-binding protein